mgnify:CR=1 FL=1
MIYKNIKMRDDEIYNKDKITEMYDFLLEDHEVYVPPVLMEGYKEKSSFWNKIIIKFRTMSVNKKATLFGIGATVLYIIANIFHQNK